MTDEERVEFEQFQEIGKFLNNLFNATPVGWLSEEQNMVRKVFIESVDWERLFFCYRLQKNRAAPFTKDPDKHPGVVVSSCSNFDMKKIKQDNQL